MQCANGGLQVQLGAQLGTSITRDSSPTSPAASLHEYITTL
jgi:hypothetical protein